MSTFRSQFNADASRSALASAASWDRLQASLRKHFKKLPLGGADDDASNHHSPKLHDTSSPLGAVEARGDLEAGNRNGSDHCCDGSTSAHTDAANPRAHQDGTQASAFLSCGECIWCNGAGCIPATGVMCRTCGGTGRKAPPPPIMPRPPSSTHGRYAPRLEVCGG